MQDENRKKLAAAHELLTSESDAPQGNYVHCQKLESGQLTVSELSIENLGTISAPVSKEVYVGIFGILNLFLIHTFYFLGL